jgi:hypothetical protein
MKKITTNVSQITDKDHFKVLKVTLLEDLVSGIEKHLPESDLTIQTDKHIVQYTHVEVEEPEKTKYVIKPGVFTLESGHAGLELSSIELKTHDLLESVNNTSIILNEAGVFFSKLDIYKKYNLMPKRSILLYSGPGMGKSSSISRVAAKFIEEDPGTVVIFWDTSDIRPSSVAKFFSARSVFSKKATRLLFVMEDIGGGNSEEYHGPKSADSGLLELLDGASISFSIPTFIIATTNTPESLLKSLADRPGRFDQMFELQPPSAKERLELASYIAKRDLTQDESEAISSSSADGLSIAHITEIVVRSDLHDKSFSDVLKEMKEHKRKIETAFQKIKNSAGIGLK